MRLRQVAQAGLEIAAMRRDELPRIPQLETHLATVGVSHRNPRRTAEGHEGAEILEAAAHHERIVGVRRDVVELRRAQPVRTRAPGLIGQRVHVDDVGCRGDATVIGDPEAIRLAEVEQQRMLAAVLRAIQTREAVRIDDGLPRRAGIEAAREVRAADHDRARVVGVDRHAEAVPRLRAEVRRHRARRPVIAAVA